MFYTKYLLVIFSTILGLVIVPAINVDAQTSSIPNSPRDLTATAISSSQVNLSWTAPSNNGGSAITGYKIEFKIVPNSYSVLVSNTGNANTSFSHTGLTSGKTYIYRVSAINSVGTSESSSEALVKLSQVSNVLPNPPTSLVARAISPKQITLSWLAPTNNNGPAITGYKIEEKTGTGTYSVLVTNTANTKTTYLRTSLTTGSTYTYKVSAINSVGTSTQSNEASATPTSTSAPNVPNPPTGLTAQFSQTQVNLSWIAPIDNGGAVITGYQIEEKTGTSSYSVLVTNTKNNNTSYSRTGLTTGTTYAYRISAINSVGTGNPSNEVSTTQTSTSTPSTSQSNTESRSPSGLAATAVSKTQVNLSWTAPSDNGGQPITGYKIEVKVGSSAYSVLEASIDTTSYAHTGLTTGKTYTYRVSAINSDSTGNPSNEASATPRSTTTPTGLTATAGSPTMVYLSWTPPTETFGQKITGYKIEKKLSSNAYTTIVKNTGTSSTTYSVTGLKTDTAYTFVVSAIISTGTTDRSNEASVTPTSTSNAPPPTAVYVPPTQSAQEKKTKEDALAEAKAETEKKIADAKTHSSKAKASVDSEKAKAKREEAKKANEKARAEEKAAKEKAKKEREEKEKQKQENTGQVKTKAEQEKEDADKAKKQKEERKKAKAEREKIKKERAAKENKKK